MDGFSNRPVALVKRKVKHLFSMSARNVPGNPSLSSSTRNITSSTSDRVRQSMGPSAFPTEAPNEATAVLDNQESASNETRPTSTTSRQPHSEGTIPWLNSVKLALQLFEKTLNSVPAPGLGGVIGGVLKIIEQYDKVTQNKKDLEELKESIEKINNLFVFFIATPSVEIPGELEQRIRIVSNELEDVNVQIKRSVTRGLFRKAVDASDDAQLVVALLRKIKFSIDKLTVVSVVKTEAIAWVVLKRSECAVLRTLPRAKTARWDYVDIEECLEGTRGGILGEIKKHVFKEEQRRIQWLNGLAGTGKSTIAKTIAHLLADESQLGASFFCSRNEANRGNVRLIFPTLAFQLSETVLGFGAELCKIIDAKPDIGYALPLEQLQKLIIDPFRKIGSHSQPILIVIDGLDECKDEKAPSTILMALAEHIATIPFLKVFVTSRPEPDMRRTFRLLQGRSNVLDLHLVDSNLVNNDIRCFLNVRLTDMASNRSVDDLLPSWPPTELVERLVQKAAGSFIFASTICKVINPHGDLDKQLKQVAKLTTDGEGRLGIDDLYRVVFESALENMSAKDVFECRSIIGTIILLRSPLSITHLSQLLFRTRSEVNGHLTKFHSVLAIPRGHKTGVVRIIHASFHDFLIDATRCSDKLLVQPALQHREITINLFQHMMIGLRGETVDIENAANPGQQSIDGVLAYACHYWGDHLSYTLRDGSDEVVTALETFFKTKFSEWSKTLHVLGSMDVIVISLEIARGWHSKIVQPRPELALWLTTQVASALHDQFRQIGRREDLNRAISLYRDVLNLQPSDRSRSLNDLSIALMTRFDRSGRHGDVDEAILLRRQALELRAAPHPDRSSSLENLGIALMTRFDQSGQHGDLDEAILLHRQALELRAAPHPDRSNSLSNLGIALMTRFDQSGQHGELDEAILLHRQALELRPASHPDRSRSVIISNLTLALSTRYDLLGQWEDLEETVVLHPEAQQMRPQRSSLNNRPLALKPRVYEPGRHGSLGETISLHRAARSRYLYNLAVALT